MASSCRNWIACRTSEPASVCPVLPRHPGPPDPRCARPADRLRPGSISALDTGFRRYDEFFALRVDDRNFSTNTLVATVISMNADKLPGNLLVIEPGRVRVRPLSR